MLEEHACAWRQNLDSLKATVVKAVREIPLAMIRELMDDWPKSLQRCVQAKDSHFESFISISFVFVSKWMFEVWTELTAIQGRIIPGINFVIQPTSPSYILGQGPEFPLYSRFTVPQSIVIKKILKKLAKYLGKFGKYFEDILQKFWKDFWKIGKIVRADLRKYLKYLKKNWTGGSRRGICTFCQNNFFSVLISLI